MLDFCEEWADSLASLRGAPSFLDRWFGPALENELLLSKHESRPSLATASSDGSYMIRAAISEDGRSQAEARCDRARASLTPEPTRLLCEPVQDPERLCSHVHRPASPPKVRFHRFVDICFFEPEPTLGCRSSACLLQGPYSWAPKQGSAVPVPRQPSMLSYTLSEQAFVRPDTITGPLVFQPLQELSALCAAPRARQGAGQYGICEPRQHFFTRPSNLEWAAADYLADATSAVHYVVRIAPFLQTPLDGLAHPQLALTPAWAERDLQALPVDLRNRHGSICTLLVRAGQTPVQVAAQVAAQGCACDELVAPLLQGSLQLHDARGRPIERLAANVDEHDWLRFVDTGGPEQAPPEDAALFMQTATVFTPCRRKVGTLSEPTAVPPHAGASSSVFPKVIQFEAKAPEVNSSTPCHWKDGSLSDPTVDQEALSQLHFPLFCSSEPPQCSALSKPTAGLDTAFHDEQCGWGTICKTSATTALPGSHGRHWQVGTLSEPTVSDQAALSEAISFSARAIHYDPHRQVGHKPAPIADAGRPTPSDPAADPPLLLTPTGIADALEPTIYQKIKADDVEVVPAFLKDRRTFEQPVAHFLWGEMSQGQHGTYTVFDRIRHVTVEKCQFQADLESIVALTLARAPFAVRSVQLLTVPLEGFPKPQIVIAEIARPRGELPIPWDLRPIGLQVSTIRHMPQQDTGAAIRALQTQLPTNTDLEGLWRDGLVHVSDALGPVEPRLTEHLDEVQFFRILRVPIAALDGHVMRSPFYFGGTGARESTVTTTWAYATGTAHSQPSLRIVVFRGDVSVSLDIRPPFRLRDEVLARLLAQHAHMRPFQPGSTLTLSRAFPPSLGYLQEVLFCISDDHTTPSFLWDARGIDGALTAQTTAVSFMNSEFVVPQEWRDQGWTAAVNGVPVSHAQRTVTPGDFYQPYRGSRHPPCVPQGHVLGIVPALNPFVWPFPLSHFQRMFLPRLRDRRWRLGMHLATAPEHLVYGPEHGEIRIHVATANHLNHEEIVSYMQRLDHPPPWGSIAPTSLNLDNVATFVSKARNSGLHTVLTPAPFFTGHFFVLLVSSRARVLRGIPLASDGALYPRQNFRQGDVLDPSHGFPRPLPDSSDLDDDTEAATQVIPATPSVAVPISDRARPSTPQEDSPQPEATALLQTRARLLQQVQVQPMAMKIHAPFPRAATPWSRAPRELHPLPQATERFQPLLDVGTPRTHG